MTWEERFRNWAKPPGKTEQDRMENAEKAIKNAIHASHDLKARNIRVFAQGSYRNNTNVRQDSDVDIAVVCQDVFFEDYPTGMTREDFGISASDYYYATFKNEVGKALVDYFGSSAVTRGNKAFDLHETSYHVDADIAPFFEHRRYRRTGEYLTGVELRPDNDIPPKVINWPDQHYENGVAKNLATGRRFKAVVRILKSLANEMAEAEIQIAHRIPGFLIECLVWNVPNNYFNHPSYTQDVRGGLAYLITNTLSDDQCNEWGEVSELKYLFCPTQKWTRSDANLFLYAVWDYIGFNDI